MKKFEWIVVVFLLLATKQSVASQVVIDHPCLDQPILEASDNLITSDETIFSLTKKLILGHKIESQLAQNGVISILNYLGPDQSLEIISETKLRAYGWCYSINGEIPDLMPDEIKIKTNDSIKWFLSFSTYDSGKWVDYCVPTKTNKESSVFVCH